MGRRKGAINKMGNSLLVKDRHKRHGPRNTNDSFLHTTELNDGTNYNRINFQSVTEQSNLEEFLNTAEMAGTDFTAERQNIEIITNPKRGIQLSELDKQNISDAQNTHRALLQIPRRPDWDESTTKEDLLFREKEAFTNWRRQLKMLEEKEHIELTPYEKNLDFWRQLWRVIERSDVVVQIVDARNPLLFRCDDLETYVKQVDPRKTVMTLVNKADYLNLQQRQTWVDYFNSVGITVVFFSAKTEKEKQESSTANEMKHRSSSDDDSTEDESEEEKEDNDNEKDNVVEDEEENDEKMETAEYNENTDDMSNDFSEPDETKNDLNSEVLNSEEPRCDVNRNCPEISTVLDEQKEDLSSSASGLIKNSAAIVSSDELLDIFRLLAHPSSSFKSAEVKTVGMVGYPNVGKSSTINVILQNKKLAVSATPGRTKYLQTLYVDKSLMLCDCPGLVFPSFVSTKAHLVINGILPIDELRDHVGPVSLICEEIPRQVLEASYSIMIPRPSTDENPDRPPTADELLNAYGAMRGFMSQRGLPDAPRAARYILKDYVKGKLLYCNPPPGIEGKEFQDKKRISLLEMHRPQIKANLPQLKSKVDTEFFSQKLVRAHSRGVKGVTDHVRTDCLQGTSRQSDPSLDSMSSTQSLGGKPWKKHNNRNKKEKLRRVHRDLDV